MYRLNPLPRKVLITTDEVIRMSPVAENPSPGNLEQAIIIAEERFVKKLMCKDFYYAFRDKKNVLVDDDNKAELTTKVNEGNTGQAIVLKNDMMINAIELVDDNHFKEWWYEFGWKITAECVLYIATPTNYSRYTSQGQMQNNPQMLGGLGNQGSGSASVTLKDIQWTMDKILMDRIDPLIEASHEWLCEADNKQHFEKYNCKPCPCAGDKNAGVSYQRKTGYVHGIYDEPTTSCCD